MNDEQKAALSEALRALADAAGAIRQALADGTDVAAPIADAATALAAVQAAAQAAAQAV